MWVQQNNNPKNKRVGDCVVRALSTALEKEWEEIYADLCLQGLLYSDLPTANSVWGAFLAEKGYIREAIPNTCRCYTVNDFCADNPEGVFILGTGTHAVTVIDGNYFDVWDSGDETPIYYFKK